MGCIIDKFNQIYKQQLANLIYLLHMYVYNIPYSYTSERCADGSRYTTMCTCKVSAIYSRFFSLIFMSCWSGISHHTTCSNDVFGFVLPLLFFAFFCFFFFAFFCIIIKPQSFKSCISYIQFEY